MKKKHERKLSKESDSNVKNDKHHRNRTRSRSISAASQSSDSSIGVKNNKIDHDALSIYIGNVDYSATEDELRDMFIGCGDIVRVTIIRNMITGHPKGAAFIEFTDKDGVQAAMILNGKALRGRPLIVTSKKPRPENRMRRTPPQRQRSLSRSRSRLSRSGGVYSRIPNRPTMRRLPPMPIPQIRATRYDPYRRAPPPIPQEFYDPYMMQRPGPPPMYHHSQYKASYSRAPVLPRYHSYANRK